MTDTVAEAAVDPTTKEFWEAAKDHRFLVQRCGACAGHQLYPRPFCLTCESSDVAWVESTGKGVVYSLTVVRVLVAELDPPYAVVLVELDEGPRVLGGVIGDVAIGDRVELVWIHSGCERPLWAFQQDRGAG